MSKRTWPFGQRGLDGLDDPDGLDDLDGLDGPDGLDGLDDRDGVGGPGGLDATDGPGHPVGLGAVEALLADDEVTEVMIGGSGLGERPVVVTVERHGEIQPVALRLNPYDVELLIEQILLPLGLRADRTSPIVDARLADGSRVNVVVPPLAVDGPSVCIRRFSAAPVRLLSFGPPEMVRALAQLVHGRANIVVAGPTGSGKTTLIGAISELFSRDERVISIEDTAELRLATRNVVRLESRPANSEGVGQVTVRQLVLNALRMRPDRLIVGEVRGAEAFDLLLALTSGHRGCVTSCHAANPSGALRRLETLAALAGEPVGPGRLEDLIGDGVDAVVVTGRAGPRRYVASVDELIDGRLHSRWRAEPGSAALEAVTPVASVAS
jgi:pilus assembly protein CpaF